jgi:formate hydrogenlyase transcriptional activator
VEQVAPTDSTVLVSGETGTGKELVARAIHDRSSRKDRPLVKVNCGAISAGLVESELFGHVKGAFTGALGNRDGRFTLADGGTIFLDEVGELPLEAQVKLLRVLQEQEFEPVGSSKSIKVDVRVIAASNRDLGAAVKDGKFRGDLFYRLNVVPISVPPLRERPGDLDLLVKFLLQKFATKLGRPVLQVPAEAMQRLRAYSWPGNVRELQNVIERAVVLAQSNMLALGADFAPPSVPAEPGATPPKAAAPTVDTTLDEVERRHIETALMNRNWLIEGDRGAARALNIHPNTLRNRMRKLGIKRPTRSA